MTKNHPITPPPELVQQWCKQLAYINEPGPIHLWLATEAARWGADQQLQLDAEQVNRAWQKGADQELEACCEWIADNSLHHADSDLLKDLRAARRPKPPSLKELNLKHLEVMERDGHYLPEIIADLRRAIEALPS